MGGVVRELAFHPFLALALSGSAAPMGLLVPACFYPGGLWNSMNWAATRVPLVAIMNPNEGPDATQNADYLAAVNSLRARRVRIAIGLEPVELVRRDECQQRDQPGQCD